jgi:hypothetical protein
MPLSLFIASDFHFNLLKLQLLLMHYMRFPFSCIFPGSNISILFIVPECFAIRSLIFLPEMCPARLISVKGIC